MKTATGETAAIDARRRQRATATAAKTAAPIVAASPVRLGKRTKELAPRLAPGTIAIIDHPDIDSVAARALARRAPAAVINVQPNVTGRYPNRGPQVFLDARVPVFESPVDLFALLGDGERLSIDGENRLLRDGGDCVATLIPLTAETLRARLDAARSNLDAELVAFAENTLSYLSRPEERALLVDAIDVPDVRTPIAGRPVLIAVRGENYEEDLARLGSYIREQRPVVIAVDGAADTLLAAGVRPNIILGDMDSIGDDALRCGAEIVVHAYARDGQNAPGLARVENLGLAAHTFPVPGTSEDAALLLAYEKGADLIVAVGTHTNLEDFLDKGRRGMASTFLVRLKVGGRLVDARGVSRLYGRQEKLGPWLIYLTLAALCPVAALLAGTPQGQVAWRAVVLWFRLLFK